MLLSSRMHPILGGGRILRNMLRVRVRVIFVFRIMVRFVVRVMVRVSKLLWSDQDQGMFRDIVIGLG